MAVTTPATASAAAPTAARVLPPWAFPNKGQAKIFFGLEAAAVTFGDGGFYRFRDKSLLNKALVVKPDGLGHRDVQAHNQKLALYGDHAVRDVLRPIWRRESGDQELWRERHDQGVGCCTYQAWKCDELGITRYVRCVPRRDGSSLDWSSAWKPHEKSTMVEAFIGAVLFDCGGDMDEVKAFMRHLHIFWPEGEDEEALMEQLMGQHYYAKMLYLDYRYYI